MILRSKWMALAGALLTVLIVVAQVDTNTTTKRADSVPEVERTATAPATPTAGDRVPVDARASETSVANCEADEAKLSRSLMVADDRLSDEERDDLFFTARAIGRLDAAHFSSCRKRLVNSLVGQSSCGRAASAIAGGLFGASNFAETEVLEVLSRGSVSCAPVFVEAAGFAVSVGTELATFLLARAKAGSVESPAAWLALGSIGESARRMQRTNVAQIVDDAIAQPLTLSLGPDALYVKAAGNAGCIAAPCRKKMQEATASKDIAVRRIGVASLRFIEDRNAVSTLCSRLEREKDSSVRDMAAWALSWRTSETELRIPCLAESALHDTSRRVRIQSTQSLGVLASNTEAARFALIHLTDGDAPPDVRDLALRILRTGGPSALAFDERAMDDFLRRAERAKDRADASKNF